MARIHRLPPDLANQIAAGEVVERPASVVKELVENAIDAGARRIDVIVEHGGKRLIRVEDDGGGMSPEDAALALERHATSKIGSVDDLSAIATHGFRGEALPSIGSVSRLRLRTRARGAPTGTEVSVEAGAMGPPREAGMPEGTLVEVRDLFANVPARRKFLKVDAAESAQVSRLVTQMALAYPDIGFTLTSAGRRTLECPPVASLADRFYQVYGDRSDLVTVRRAMSGLAVEGFVAALAADRPLRGPQHLFVNRRIVRDRTVAHAIQAAYAEATIKERSPEVHLFLTVPAERVDVNVHPTKAEVRFLDQSLVHEVVRRAVADALGVGPGSALGARGAVAVPGGPATPAGHLPDVLGGASFGSRWLPGSALGGAPSFAGEPAAAYLPGGEGTATPDRRSAALAASLGPLAQAGPLAAGGVDPGRPLIPLGQFRDTFIVAVDADGIAIIDQHVAHERILYEQVLERLASGRVPGQRLLTPLVLELPPGRVEALEVHRADLDRLGFEVEGFGGGSVRVTAIPALLDAAEADRAVRALAEDLDGFDRGGSVDAALKLAAATTACHAAVKANQPLTFEKMVHLLEGLRRTAYSQVCPHGRPVVLRLDRRDLERSFERR